MLIVPDYRLSLAPVTSRVFGILAANRHSTVLNPHVLIRPAINQTGSAIFRYLDDVNDDIARGKSADAALNDPGKLARVIRHGYATARLAGFQHAGTLTKARMSADYGATIGHAAQRRGLIAARLMHGATHRALNRGGRDDWAFSQDRALRAARYESARAYFDGVLDGLYGSGRKKSWFTTSGNPCEDCQSNEDEGPIGVDEAFGSGWGYPPVHINCACGIVVS